MKLRTALTVLLASLMVSVTWADWPAPGGDGLPARTQRPGDGPKPAMIVDGHTLTPAVWVEGLDGETVEVDGVEMIWVGKAAKAAGGSATMQTGPEGKILQLRAGIRTMEFVILPPGEFWRHPWVRWTVQNASGYQLQPLPLWPYVEANIPATPPHHVSPQRPYLHWTPDEAWLLLNLTPPAPVEEEVIVVEDEDEEADEEDGEEADDDAAEEDVDADGDVEMDAGPGAGMGGGAPAPGGMGGPPAGEMGGAPPGEMGGMPGGEEPPPMPE
jgi:hypothetical protein